MAFIAFVVLSTPVGFHHQFADPGISAGWKLAHTVTTYAVVYPSFVMAFTVIASLEVAGRMKGARGLFNWIGRLPWADPFFSSVALSMIAFVFGGFGGVINGRSPRKPQQRKASTFTWCRDAATEARLIRQRWLQRRQSSVRIPRSPLAAESEVR